MLVGSTGLYIKPVFNKAILSGRECECKLIKYTIVYPPTISWHEPIFQRPHQLQSEFARQGHFAVLVNLWDDGKGNYWFAADHLCISNNLADTLNSPEIMNLMKDTKVVFWVTWAKTMYLKDLVKPDIIVFDYIDEAAEEFSHWQEKLDHCLDIADVIFVTSRRLFELVQHLYPKKTFLVRNGADIHQYLEGDYHIPPDLEHLKERYKYIVGFHGSLQSWVDYPLIKEMALERPDWGFALVGPEYYPADILKDVSNIHFLGIKSYHTLLHYVKNFDIGIIPFQVRDLTHSSNPIKMYEYLASGIPVVATPIKECLELQPYVRIAATGSESVDKIEEAIRSAKDEKERYIEIAKANSWAQRVKDILAVLGELR